MSISTTPYVSKSGGIVFFPWYASTAPFGLLNVTGVAASPTIYVNGVQASILGPFWPLSTKDVPWVAYQLLSLVKATDLVTYTAPAAWVTTASGSASAQSSQASVLNYTGQLEPAIGNGTAMGPPAKYTMGLGCNMNWPVYTWNQQYSHVANWIHRSNNPWTHVITQTDDGHPSTFNNNTQTTIFSGFTDPVTANSYLPGPTGTWALVVDESAPSTPMAAAMTYWTNSIAVNYLGSTPGVLTNGVEVGKMFQWTTSYLTPNTNAAVWIQQMAINATAWNSANGASYTWSNEFLFAPVMQAPASQPPNYSRSIPFRMDPNLVLAATTPQGNNPAAIRTVDATQATFQGVSNVVDVSDLRPANTFSWQVQSANASVPTGQRTIQFSQIRTYSLNAINGVTPGSPYIYNNQYGANSNSGIAPFQWTVNATFPNIGYLNVNTQNGTGWCAMEIVTATNHNLKTGQMVQVNGSINANATFTNGGSPTVTANLKGISLCCWVTSSNTFACSYFIGTSNTNGQTGNMNNVSGLQTFNTTAVINVPDAQAMPFDVMASCVKTLPNTNVWVNVPAAATNATVTQIATLVLQNSSVGTDKIIEYSNEHWNNTGGQIQGWCWSWGAHGIGAITGNTNTNLDGYYVFRAKQVHDIFYSVFNAAGRGAEIKRYFGAWLSVQSTVTNMITYATSSNANANAPIPMDYVGVACYRDMNNDIQADPSTQATVNATGGGSVGGAMLAGNYRAAYTIIDIASGQESGIGTTESAVFTVANGNIPTVTIAFPSYGTLANIYVTPTNGAAGSEVLYAANVNTTTFNCNAAVNANASAYPPHSRIPSFRLAAASMYQTCTNSLAYGGTITPFTHGQYLDMYRHYLHYSTTFLGNMSATLNAIALYTPVNGQAAGYTPSMVGYEGALQQVIPVGTGAGTSDNINNAGAPYMVLSCDVLYAPEIYDSEIEYLTTCQNSGLLFLCTLAFVMPPQANKIWGYQCYPGQPWGYGDGSDGKATNVFVVNTNAPTHGRNVAVKLQAWRDWLDGTAISAGATGGGNVTHEISWQLLRSTQRRRRRIGV